MRLSQLLIRIINISLGGCILLPIPRPFTFHTSSIPLPSRREHISFALRTSPYPRFTLLDYKKKLFFFLSKIIKKFNLFNLVNLRTKNFSLILGNFRLTGENLWISYAKIVTRRYKKNGISTTPLNCARNALIFELNDSAEALVALWVKKLRISSSRS